MQPIRAILSDELVFMEAQYIIEYHQQKFDIL